MDVFDQFWQLDEKPLHQLEFITDFLTGIRLYPYHLRVDSNIPFVFSRNDELIREDCELHGLRVAQSSIVPEQEGLFSERRFSAGEFIAQYWGKLLVSDKENDLKDYECWGNDDRILSLQVQPFAEFGKTVFVIGSKSSIATYANSSHGVLGSEPNCEFTETSFSEFDHHSNDLPFPTFDCFLNWLSACPMQLRAIRDIDTGEELTVDYEYVIEIESD